MTASFVVNWLARPKLRRASGYLLAVVRLASRSVLRGRFSSPPATRDSGIFERRRAIRDGHIGQIEID